jgi:DNA-binding transcriptional MocR family regulator
MAARDDVPILEDDPCHELPFEGEPLPSLMAIDADRFKSDHRQEFQGNVIYLGTMSKLLGPGLRLGWAVAPTSLIHRMTQAKQGVDLHTRFLSPDGHS